MNLNSNDECIFLLCGAPWPCKGKLKSVLWVAFDIDVPRNAPTFMVDAKYESKEFYDNISKDSTNGQELRSRYGLDGSQTKAIQLVENQNENGSKFRNKTPLSAHHLPLLCLTLKPPSMPTMPPFVASLLLSPILATTILVDAGYASNLFHDKKFINHVLNLYGTSICEFS
jgi:hypothetical protein